MILSVPHNGTRSLRALTGHRAIHVHAPDAAIDELIARQPEILCPLRDPWSVYVSFYSRMGTGHGTNVTMEYCYRRLVELDERLDIIYFPLDIDPAYQLARLGAVLWRDFHAWPAEGHYPRKEPPYKDLSWIYELPMVREFYEHNRV